jgi:hypothetical protein
LQPPGTTRTDDTRNDCIAAGDAAPAAPDPAAPEPAAPEPLAPGVLAVPAAPAFIPITSTRFPTYSEKFVLPVRLYFVMFRPLVPTADDEELPVAGISVNTN